MGNIGIAVAWEGSRKLDFRQPFKHKQEISRTGGVHKKKYIKELLLVKTETKLVFFNYVF